MKILGSNLVKLCRNQWDRAGGLAAVAAGFVALLVAWVGVSDTILTFEQIPYVISGGFVGVSLVVLGATLWISADLRDEWRKLDSLEEAVRESSLQQPSVVLTDADDEASSNRRRHVGVSEG